MTPTIAGSEKAMDADEPGGRTCVKCHEEFSPGDHVYREVFGKVGRLTDHGVVYSTTGGVPVRHFCHGCWNEHRGRDKAAHYDVTDGDRLWNILEAADGDLVADMRPMLLGGRGWIRVVDGDVEARYTITKQTADGKIAFDTELDEDFDVDDFGRYFDDPGERTRVLLRPVDETPFASEVDDAC